VRFGLVVARVRVAGHVDDRHYTIVAQSLHDFPLARLALAVLGVGGLLRADDGDLDALPPTSQTSAEV